MQPLKPSLLLSTSTCTHLVLLLRSQGAGPLFVVEQLGKRKIHTKSATKEKRVAHKIQNHRTCPPTLLNSLSRSPFVLIIFHLVTAFRRNEKTESVLHPYQSQLGRNFSPLLIRRFLRSTPPQKSPAKTPNEQLKQVARKKHSSSFLNAFSLALSFSPILLLPERA